MMGYEAALAVIMGETAPLQPRHCAPGLALGHVLAESVVSSQYLPAFDNAAMDGFALRTGGALLLSGQSFEVTGAQAAGDTHVRAMSGAWEIMTGARMPEGLDAVVPVEQTDVLATDGSGRPSRMRLTANVAPGQHVRLRGEDVVAGATVMAAGTCIDPAQLMVLAALGVAQVAVVRKPRLALITTGRELVDDAAQPLASGEIRNANGPFLAARAMMAGADVVLRETVGDEPALFQAALDRALAAGADVVVSTGAVSMGRHDFVPDALRATGAKVHFHKVRIRPGKPLLFARLPGGQLYFGLPGNPVSCAVGLRFFVEPALRGLLGMAPELPLRVPLAEPYVGSGAMRVHLKARVDCDTHGRFQARVLPGQESFRILPLMAANAWIVVPEAITQCRAGDLVDVFGLGHLQAPQLGEVVA